MLDCHSGDDLGAGDPTRASAGRPGGDMNFKVSPQPQVLLAETLFDTQRDLFDAWWNDVLAFATAEAARGSSIAVACLADLAKRPGARPDALLFHSYAFTSVGRRDAAGRFVNRERLYELSPETLAEYGARLERWLLEIAEDLYGAP